MSLGYAYHALPSYPAYENSTRTNGANIPSIPSLPISWANAQVLLREIEAGGANRTIRLVNHGSNISCLSGICLKSSLYSG
jgi:hypothetical protein